MLAPPPNISGRFLVGRWTLPKLWAQDASSGNNRWPDGFVLYPVLRAIVKDIKTHILAFGPERLALDLNLADKRCDSPSQQSTIS